jgi:hypothetical protein
MWPFKRKHQLPQLPPTTAASAAPVDPSPYQILGTVLGQIAETNLNAMAKLSELTTQMVETRAQDALALGRKVGGKMRAKSAKRTATGKYVKRCRLCANPLISDPTSDEITTHYAHMSNPRTVEKEPPRRREPVEEPLQIGEHEITHDAAGNEIHECPTCSGSLAPGQTHVHVQPSPQSLN